MRIICIGRVDVEKRPFDAIQIAKKVKEIIPGVELVWIGSGSLFRKYKKLVEKEPYIQFLGPVSEREKHDWLKKGQVFISTSQREGFCIPIGEALLVGLPVIAYDLPVYYGVYSDTVIYIPRFDTNAFAKAVVDVLLHPDSYKELVRKGQGLVKRRYNPDRIAVLVEKALEEILSK